MRRRLIHACRWLLGRSPFGGFSYLIHFHATGYTFRTWNVGRLHVVWDRPGTDQPAK